MEINFFYVVTSKRWSFIFFGNFYQQIQQIQYDTIKSWISFSNFLAISSVFELSHLFYASAIFQSEMEINFYFLIFFRTAMRWRSTWITSLKWNFAKRPDYHRQIAGQLGEIFFRRQNQPLLMIYFPSKMKLTSREKYLTR